MRKCSDGNREECEKRQDRKRKCSEEKGDWVSVRRRCNQGNDEFGTGEQRYRCGVMGLAGGFSKGLGFNQKTVWIRFFISSKIMFQQALAHNLTVTLVF